MLSQAVTSRPPAYSYILVDSTDRYPDGFPATYADVKPSNNWKLQFNQNVSNGYIQRLSCTQVVFNWNLPTIITGYNDSFYMSVNGGAAKKVTIAQGFWDINALETQIENALNAAFAPLTFDVNYLTANVGFNVDCTTLGTVMVVIPPSGILNSDKKIVTRCLTTLGLIRTNVPYTSSFIFGGQPTMLATKYVDICSSVLTKYQRVTDICTLPNNPNASVLARVFPLGLNTVQSITDPNFIANQPFTVAMDFNTPKSMQWNPDAGIANFDIQLRDDFGDLIPDNGTNSCEYQLTLLMTES